MANDPTVASGAARRFVPRGPRLNKRFALAASLGLVVGLGVWIALRWHHITENDAKVMADMITISSRVDGWVSARPVTDGDAVAQGAALVTIDQREAKLAVEELRAKERSLRLDAERLQAQLAVTQGASASEVEAARARFATAEADLHAQEAELERVKLDYDRNKRLVAGEVISRQAWDVSRTTTRQLEDKLAAAKGQVDAAKANLANAQAKLGDVAVLRKQIEQCAADTAQVQAQIRRKEVELDDRVVRSPVNGVVDQKFVEPGEYVIPGQRLVLLHDPKAVWIEVHLKETKLAALRPGQPVAISVDAYPDRLFTGRVERIGSATTSQFALLPSPNPSGNFTKITQRVPVRIQVDQPTDNPLRPGMMVEVDIDPAHG
jgi:membrane fusion protein (multidrug efflux system)